MTKPKENEGDSWQERFNEDAAAPAVEKPVVLSPEKPKVDLRLLDPFSANELRVKVLVLQRELYLAKAEIVRYQLKELGVQV